MLRILTTLVGLLAASAAVEAADSALLGCWRSQQVQVTLADQSRRDQNGDCVTEYDGTKARSRCHSESGDIEILSSYESFAPGQLRVTMLDPASGKPKAAPSELRYRIDEDWLLIERPIIAAAAPTGASSKQPTSLKSVSIRVAPAADKKSACKPRGSNPLRIGKTPVSALALTVPAGWEPWLVDPASDQRLAPAVNASLFVGAFVPQGTAASASGPSQLVLVLDDVRSGPSPVRSAEFAAIKKRFAHELGSAQPGCDLPDRVCGQLRLPDGGQVYTELFNIRGRVAMVSSTVHSATDSTSLLRKSVQTFVDRLRIDNAP
ncbi:MAG TPA: hypothetical protein VKI18_05815 [Albitalea sp.]|nr:hypothetical protein [Albitalea sp.]